MTVSYLLEPPPPPTPPSPPPPFFYALSSYCYQSPCRQQDFPRGWKQAVGVGLYCFTGSSRQKKERKRESNKNLSEFVSLISLPTEACTCAKTQRHEKSNCARLRQSQRPRGVAWQANCEPSKLFRPRKLTMGRIGRS